jgi:hypothetical protein
MLTMLIVLDDRHLFLPTNRTRTLQAIAVLQLKRLGYSTIKIKEGIKDANVARYRRQRTRELLHFSRIQELF